MGQKRFSWKTQLSHTTSYGFLAPCQNLEKVNDTVQRKPVGITCAPVGITSTSLSLVFSINNEILQKHLKTEKKEKETQ